MIFANEKIYDKKIESYSKRIIKAIIFGIFVWLIIHDYYINDNKTYILYIIIGFIPSIILIYNTLKYTKEKKDYIKQKNKYAEIDTKILQELGKGIDWSYEQDSKRILKPGNEKPRYDVELANELINKKIEQEYGGHSDKINKDGRNGARAYKTKAYKLIYLLKIYCKNKIVLKIDNIEISLSDFITLSPPIPKYEIYIHYTDVVIYDAFSNILTRKFGFCEWLVHYYFTDNDKIKKEFIKNFEGFNIEKYSYVDMLYMNMEKERSEHGYDRDSIIDMTRYITKFLL